MAPTASEITRAEFKGRLTIRGEEISRPPSEALPDLAIRRFPADISIEIAPPSDPLTGHPSCCVRVYDGGKPIQLLQVLDGDQLLVGTDWYPLPPESIEAIRDLLSSVRVMAPGRLTLRQYLDLRGLNSSLVKIVDSEDEAEERPSGSESIPEGLKADLYPYQETGFQWLSRIADEGLGCILADQMGLGKTLQIIALLLRESKTRGAPSLVVAPATLLENWRRELNRFAPALAVLLHQGRERTGFPRNLQKFDVVIASYDTAMRDISIMEMVGWNIVVLDEAQAIKTPDAQRTVTLKTLPRRMAVAVSGTPVENRLRDLWSLMDFAVPGLLGPLNQFEAHYLDDEDHASELEPLVSPLILRRLVADVAKDLPDRIDIPQAIQLSDEAAHRYDEIRHEVVAEYGKMASLVALTKLRMFCTHPFLLSDETGDPLPHSSKYARLLEILDEVFLDGEKVLIFTSYTRMADILAEDLHRRYKLPFTIIDGRTPVTDRQPTVDRFGQITTSAGLILNPKAAGTGLNITAANHVVHFNLEWNPALEDQATARAYRRGQTRPVTVHRLFHPGTVEEVIDQRTARKRVIASSAVVGTEGTENDIADIVRSLELSPVMGGLKNAN
ncbi:ATP-dependent helicase HepA [Planctomyces sp. SH-PL14]|nr:ATP-dependent helicase HepA [Planctomyces sp. SH-PL14]